MKTKLTIGVLIWVLSVLISSGAFGQPTQSDSESATEVYAWTGATPSLKACAIRVAKVQAQIEVDADYAKANKALDEIWLMVAANDSAEGQSQLLVEVALARAELYRRQGDYAKALEATQHLLPRKQDIARMRVAQEKVALASKLSSQRAKKAIADARLAKFRATLEGADSNNASLDAIVKRAYSTGEFAIIAEIGAPAQETFMQHLLQDAESLPGSAQADPLYYLIQMNERRAAELLLANLDAGGYLWKRRIVRAMDSLDVLNNDGTWSSQSPYVCLEPEWLSMLEALLASPETAIQSAHMVKDVFLRDQVTPGLQSAIVRGIQNFELDFVNEALRAMDQGGVVRSALPVFEAAAKHEDPQVRRFAARTLANYESNEVLESLSEDPDPIVRSAVARVLQKHEGAWVYPHETRGDWVARRNTLRFRPTVTQNGRAILARFTQDTSVKVRRLAANALIELPTPLEHENYLRLARDTDAEVRATVAKVASLPGELRSQILTMLATDSDSEVVETVDRQLEEAPLASSPEHYLEALKIRLYATRVPMESSMFNTMRELMHTPVGIQALTTWLLEKPNTKQVDVFADLLSSQGYELLLDLDDENLGRFLALIFQREKDSGRLRSNTIKVISTARPSRLDAMRSVLKNTSFDMPVRLTAGELAAWEGGPEFTEAFFSLLKDQYWKANAPSHGDAKALSQITQALPESEANPLILRAISDKSIQDRVAQIVARRYLKSGNLAQEVTLAALARWFKPDGPYVEAVDRAILNLSAFPEDASSELLEAAIFHPSYAENAARVLVSLRRPESLPILERCLQAEWIADKDVRTDVQAHVAKGLSSFFSDESAAILLRGLASPDFNVRRICAEGLDHIEHTRAREKRWEALGKGQPTKQSALAELLEMLEDENEEVRIQAIRGVATFGAIEYLPTLIRILKDPNAKIVAAARLAIDKLSSAVSESK